MASLNFNSLKNKNLHTGNYTYVDFHLDFTDRPIGRPTGKDVIKDKFDIKVAYDINAVKNSLMNLFNTSKHERILNPEYGCDLREYVFEAVSESTAMRIGREIRDVITKWEPRVNVVSIEVGANEDEHYYEIDLLLDIPFKNEQFTLQSILNRQGILIK